MILRDIRKKVKKIEPIDIIKSSTKSRKRYLHMEILQKVLLIEEIEPMSINEIRGILNIDQIENQETSRNFEKKEKKK